MKSSHLMTLSINEASEFIDTTMPDAFTYSATLAQIMDAVLFTLPSQ